MPIKAITNGVEKEITRIPVLGHDIETATGTNSITFNTSSDRIIEYDILGNTQQTGTPAPDAPIMPQLVGERTGNLFDGTLLVGYYYDSIDNLQYSQSFRSFRIQGLPAGQYTISWNIPVKLVRAYYNGTMHVDAGDNLTSYTVTSSDGDIAVSFRDATSTQTPWSDSNTVMLNTGSTPLPYEPYGYKVSISCGSQTTPVYLGQTQTLRRIKKLVLTGQEIWSIQSQAVYINKSNFPTELPADNLRTLLCSHFPNGDAPGKMYNGNNYKLIYTSPTPTTVDDWKAYLQQQYSAGTPVTVWYILATPETAIVNEPLAKIGDYADELHSEDAGVTIPTTKGQNTLTVDTSLSPSQTTVTYRGTTAVYKDAWEVRDNQDRLLWYREDTLTGVSPISFRGYGVPLKSIKIVGNTQQNGTPTPDAPIMPTFCGVRTENLIYGFDYYGVVPSINNGNNANYNNGASTDYIKIDNPLITLSKDSSFVNARIYIFLYNENKTFIGYAMSDNIKIVSWSISNYVSAKFARIRVDGYAQYAEQYMLNSGSTPLPYEPYGWAEKITCAGQTVPIYLGQTQTVRRIKKLVLTGTENYGTSGGNTWLILGTSAADFRGTADGAICSHLPLVLRSNFTTNTCAWGGGQIGDFLINIDNKNMAELKQYIAQQYSAGTPVTIWYVLANEETSIVNEPLAKIGTYADELTTVPGITPQTGTNTLTVDTTLSPSLLSITGHVKGASA